MCAKQAREIELHEAYAKLTAGAMERGKLRSQLINTEVSRRVGVQRLHSRCWVLDVLRSRVYQLTVLS